MVTSGFQLVLCMLHQTHRPALQDIKTKLLLLYCHHPLFCISILSVRTTEVESWQEVGEWSGLSALSGVPTSGFKRKRKHG